MSVYIKGGIVVKKKIDESGGGMTQLLSVLKEESRDNERTTKMIIFRGIMGTHRI